MNKFSIIIPSKEASNLGPCVESIREAGETSRIIIVDDGVTWNGGPVRLQAGDCIVTGAEPFVFARNINLGIQAAGEDDVILMNDDALLKTPNGFSMMSDFATLPAQVGVKVGCVVPSTNITGQSLQWPQNRTPIGWRECSHVPYVCVYIPRSTLNVIGLLDERYCLDYGVEDRDHLESMTRAGFKSLILYDVFVDHGSLRSSFRGDPKAPGDYSRNQVLYNQKWGV